MVMLSKNEANHHKIKVADEERSSFTVPVLEF